MAHSAGNWLQSQQITSQVVCVALVTGAAATVVLWCAGPAILSGMIATTAGPTATSKSLAILAAQYCDIRAIAVPAAVVGMVAQAVCLTTDYVIPPYRYHYSLHLAIGARHTSTGMYQVPVLSVSRLFFVYLRQPKRKAFRSSELERERVTSYSKSRVMKTTNGKTTREACRWTALKRYLFSSPSCRRNWKGTVWITSILLLFIFAHMMVSNINFLDLAPSSKVKPMEEHEKMMTASQSQVIVPPPIQDPLQLLIARNQVELQLPVSESCAARESEIEEFCQIKKCQLHERDVIPAATAREAAELHKTSNSFLTKIISSSTTKKQCKTLWFAGFSEGPGSRCRDAGGTGIRMVYAAALQSARVNAADVPQPVLLLGRLGQKPDEDISALRVFAAARGAIIVTVDRLSFQDDISRWYQNKTTNTDHMIGPYLRMDIPWIVEKHGLFDLPDICPQHILYTDADSLFVNPVSHADMDALKAYMVHRKLPPWQHSPEIRKLEKETRSEPPFIMYGRESTLTPARSENTGVMLMDVQRFGQELPSIIRFRNEHTEQSIFTVFDQSMLNYYFDQDKIQWGRHLLPLYWNWKLYWKLESSTFRDLKLVHFHGPKPDTGAWSMADCNTNMSGIGPGYHAIVEDSICCDRGKTTARVREFYNLVAPPPADVC